MPPVWLQYAVVAGLGLIFGSFTNVLVVRVPRAESIVAPRSRCPSCGRTLSWAENIPVLSYLFLRGRCRGCGAGIPLRYPVIEVLVAVVFIAMFLKTGWTLQLFIRDFPLAVLLIAITFIDLEFRIIPDRLSLTGLGIGLLTAFAVPSLTWMEALTGAAFGFGFFYAVAWIYLRLTGRSGLGGGDIKLLAMLGAFFGPYGVFMIIFVSSVLGSVIGITWAVAARQKNIMKAAIPYGPFLVLGALVFYLLGDFVWLQFTIPM